MTVGAPGGRPDIMPKHRFNRGSIRLNSYDYSQAGAYFITLCTHNRDCIFGYIDNGEMRYSAFGEIVVNQWLLTESLRSEISLDAWVLMPNHFHGIFFIRDSARAQGDRPVAPTLASRSVGSLVAGFKSACTTQINTQRGSLGAKVWQRNYWDRVIRNEAELTALREYIVNNPRKWTLDTLYMA
ncbi:Uncharacterised protein [Zhongshania aliphaticivorans]|uniref:Transposase IS200-like domain-containing protein n=1 Tax=Zhongshania aliphaticivorans TaxID=1470434 RepID=A0A5S9NE25_9GAMM|nr:transposase [Zhongshania aliphaticivorans]CAA0088559.1 Uncharacterised protein [Zhongshania aliphaticivorans]CAA0094638.1 Uncharacterised protein [Zhongshania aliphaticivorans]